MLRSYKFRLYPTKEQATLLEKHFGCARWIWNWALAKRTELWQKEHKSISCTSLCKEIPGLKQAEETKWLAEVNAQTLQAVTRNLDTAYTNFFREKTGFPKFKSKKGHQSFHCPQRCFVDFDTRKLNIPKIPSIKYKDKRRFTGVIKTVTVSRTPSGKYFASVLIENGLKDKASDKQIETANTVGVDLGLKTFCTLSTGEKIEAPKPLKWAQRKLRRAQRSLSRKKVGSKNREKCRKHVARIHERVVCIRRDFQHKLSTRLIRENQAVALETLNVTGMQKNHKLARSISDAGWSEFVYMLEYKARWHGKTILRIGQFEPSSRLCSCGVVNSALKLSDREWTCGSCGVAHDRDVLAANNIKNMALHPQNFLAQGMREFKPVESRRGSVKQECS